MTNCDKISVDFHGVITAEPEFFGAMMQIWHKQGIKVYVVSGGPCDYIKQYLAEHKIVYDKLWCIFDHFNAIEKIEVAADGSFHIDDELWNAAKGQYCAQEKIGLHIDDSKIYGKYFTTPYVRFDNKARHFAIGGAALWVDLGAEQAAKILQAIANSSSF